MTESAHIQCILSFQFLKTLSALIPTKNSLEFCLHIWRAKSVFLNNIAVKSYCATLCSLQKAVTALYIYVEEHHKWLTVTIWLSNKLSMRCLHIFWNSFPRVNLNPFDKTLFLYKLKKMYFNLLFTKIFFSNLLLVSKWNNDMMERNI